MISSERLEAERQRARPALSAARGARVLNSYTDMVVAEAKTYRRPKATYPRIPSSRLSPDIEALTLPAPTPAAQQSPARAKAEAEGYASFGRRTWFLVEREGRYRAVETMDDAPGWSLVERMKR